MDIRKPKTMQRAAKDVLRRSPEAQRLVLLHTAVALGAGFLITFLDFLLSRSIESTGGLAGLQTRSILETVRSVLQMASSVLLPFWQLGILRAAMAFARQEQTSPNTLTAGFRRFGPALRLMLLRIVVIGGLAMFCTYAATAIFMATPLSDKANALLAPLLSEGSLLSDPTAALDDATMAAITDAVMLPMIPILMLLMAAVAIPLLYRLRLSDYLILDEPRCGALQAFGHSLKATKGYGFALFRIDLSFWWFYGLQVLFSLVGYGDALLPELGITLPVSENTAFFLFYVLAQLLQLGLFWLFGAHVFTTQALAYDQLTRAQTEVTE